MTSRAPTSLPGLSSHESPPDYGVRAKTGGG
jgi:hypothetical protein